MDTPQTNSHINPIQAIDPMPRVNPRRPYNDDQPDGYLENLNDWYHNNEEAVQWFLENAETLKTLIK